MAANLPDDIFNRISLNENVWSSIEISRKLVSKGPIENKLVLPGSGNGLAPNRVGMMTALFKLETL